MDEPSAALTADEGARLFEIVRGLKRQGTTIVYVSHFLDEVLALVDTVTVLKDGKLVRTSPAAVRDARSARHRDARDARSSWRSPRRRSRRADAPVVLSVRGLAREGVIQDVSLEVRAGEIVGLAGLIGSGRSEVARAIFGADRRDARRRRARRAAA